MGRAVGPEMASRVGVSLHQPGQGLTPFPQRFYRETQGAASLPGVEDPLDLVAGQSGRKGSLLCYGTAGLAPLRRDALLHPTIGAKPRLNFFFFFLSSCHFFPLISPMPFSSDVTPHHIHTHSESSSRNDFQRALEKSLVDN